MTLRDDLLRYVKETLLRGAEDIGPEDSLIDRGVVDSIGLMQLMTYMEERTGTRIPNHLVTPDNFQSVAAMERLLQQVKAAAE